MTDDTLGFLLLGRSKIRQRILALIMDVPGRRMHLRGIARAVGTSAGTAARELGRLEDAGLVRRTREGNQVYFEARPNQPLFGQIRDIVRQVAGAPIILRRQLSGLAGVERVVIFGSYADGSIKPDSDVDVLIIGTPDRDELTDRLEMASLEISRPVKEVVMTQRELDARRARGDRLVGSIDAGITIPVIERDEAHGNEPDPIGIAIAHRMRKGLSDIYRERLRGVFLYGSRARGESGPDSDVDILVVLDQMGPYGIELRLTSGLASDVSLDAGLIVSRTFASEADWLTGAKPFLVSARADAVEA
jgi:predicted nucleotidyltransferase